MDPVNYAVYAPSREPNKERVVLDGEKERQGDYVFTASETGEYRFCFDNTMSTFSDKVVDFEITVGSAQAPEPRPQLLTTVRSRTSPGRTFHRKQEQAPSN